MGVAIFLRELLENTMFLITVQIIISTFTKRIYKWICVDMNGFTHFVFIKAIHCIDCLWVERPPIKHNHMEVKIILHA